MPSGGGFITARPSSINPKAVELVNANSNTKSVAAAKKSASQLKRGLVKHRNQLAAPTQTVQHFYKPQEELK